MKKKMKAGGKGMKPTGKAMAKAEGHKGSAKPMKGGKGRC